ncbi:MAG TPA: lysylphosphatidylglycerol synthase domain-containing protein, partial [Polyangiaceae bacterium]|nr:lysylphosphatidylglycerol synthase domain-containing protein [Polyangiaceae bacterium]
FPLLLVMLVGLLVLPQLVSVAVARVRFRSPRARQALESARSSLNRAQDALRAGPFVVKFVALNLVVVVVQVAMLWLAFDAVGGPPDVGRLMLFQVLLKLSGMIMITPGNLGLMELAYGALAGASSTGVQHGIAAALLMRTLGTVVLIALGVSFGGAQVLMQQRRQFAQRGADPER